MPLVATAWPIPSTSSTAYLYGPLPLGWAGWVQSSLFLTKDKQLLARLTFSPPLQGEATRREVLSQGRHRHLAQRAHSLPHHPSFSDRFNHFPFFLFPCPFPGLARQLRFSCVPLHPNPSRYHFPYRRHLRQRLSSTTPPVLPSPAHGLFHACRCGIACTIPASWDRPYNATNGTPPTGTMCSWSGKQLKTFRQWLCHVATRCYSSGPVPIQHRLNKMVGPPAFFLPWNQLSQFTESFLLPLPVPTSTYLQMPVVCHAGCRLWAFPPTWRVGYFDMATKDSPTWPTPRQSPSLGQRSGGTASFQWNIGPIILTKFINDRASSPAIRTCQENSSCSMWHGMLFICQAKY